jgi:hypothetical protein
MNMNSHVYWYYVYLYELAKDLGVTNDDLEYLLITISKEFVAANDGMYTPQFKVITCA